MAVNGHEEIIPLILHDEVNHCDLPNNESIDGTMMKSKPEEKISIRYTFGGYCLALLASSIFTFNGILVQYYKLNSVDTVTVRSVFQILVLGAVLTFKG